MEKLKYIKIEHQDGTLSENVPIGVDANNVDVGNEDLSTKLDRLDANDTSYSNSITNLNFSVNNLQSQVSGLASGSPAGVYATVAALTSADPDHNKIYVVAADGHWYYYNNGWQNGGIYQAAEDSENIESLNSLSENLFVTVLDETFEGDESGYIRNYRPFNIKTGAIYRVEINIENFHANATSESVFSLRTTLRNQNTSASIKDLIYAFDYDEISESLGEHIFYYIPTQPLSWWYIYSKVNGVYKYNIKIKELISDYKTITNNNFSIVNKIIKSGFNKISNFKVTSSEETQAGIQRIFLPYNFKKDKKYLINVKFNRYIGTVSTTFSLKTTLEDDKDTVVNTIDIYDFSLSDVNKKISTFDGENCLYLYTPSSNAYYLYLYLNLLSNYLDYDIEVDIYTQFENEEVGNFVYNGPSIKLNKNNFDCNLDMTITTPTSEAVQGMAIFDNKLFQLQHKGILNIYDFENKNSVPLATCNLETYSATGNHANCCNFSNKYYQGNTIPLLYIVGGNSGEVMECDVENIILTENNGTYTATSQLVQIITLDQSGFESAGYVPYWGWSCWLTSPDNKYLYYFGAKYRTNGSMDQYYDDNRYIITKFNYPDLSNSNVTLTANDVLDQFTTPYEINVTQGGTLYDNKIYYSFGFGTTTYPARIGVWDLRTRSYTNLIELSNTPVSTQEPEDLYVYNDSLYLMTGSKKLYKLDF